MTELISPRPSISDKPFPVPIEMRPLWRMCLILISIVVVSAEKRYLDTKKVNILVWMLIRRSQWDAYEQYLLDMSPAIPLVSVDTATYKALEFLLATQLVTITDGRIHVTDHGIDLVATLGANQIMLDEIDFLTRLGKKLTAEKVRGLTGGD